MDESFRIPRFDGWEGDRNADDSAMPIDFRIGWNEKALFLSVRVSGKKRPPWCRLTHSDESEGVQICLDTRDVRNVHRATRYCHRFAFLPLGRGPDGKEPAVLWFPVHRAKGHPNTVATERIAIQSEIFQDGYRIDAKIPGDVLTGYDPGEHSRLGFHYYLVDKENGNQPFLVGPPFPHDQDPSMWGTLECCRNQ
ncbi:MAG: hypothetical protein FWC43_10170 [Planctomycetaceae bacterium]|nr:hypothetical protein [Planctomycetaceae bacterium]